MLSTDGPGRNVLKFKPPMCFSLDNVQHVVAKLDAILTGKHKAPCPADHMPRTQPSSYNGLVYSGEGGATAELGILSTVQEAGSSSGEESYWPRSLLFLPVLVGLPKHWGGGS